jgi:uncharacterized protein
MGIQIDEAEMATASDEEPVLFESGAASLFGIVTTRRGSRSDVGVIVLSGGPKGTATIGRNRLYVRMCRTLASAGVQAVRFDYHGTGESTGALEAGISLRTPFTEDVCAVAGWLRGRGVSRIILVGTCFGSRSALAAAPSIAGLAGVVLISPPLRDMRQGEAKATRVATTLTARQLVRRALRVDILRGLLDQRRRAEYARIARMKLRGRAGRSGATGRREPAWLADGLVQQLEALMERQVPTLVLYGDDELFYREFQEAQAGRLGPVLDRGGDNVEIETLPGEIHGFTSIAAQDGTIASVHAWVSRHCAADG